MRWSGDARINLDANLRVGSECKTLCGVTEKLLHLLGRQVSGSSASPVKLHNGTVAGDEPADMLDFPLENLNIRRRDAVILGDHHIARAEQAQAVAEGKMHVERNG